MTFRILVLLAATLLSGCTTVRPTSVTGSTPFKVAITIDDLPVHGPIPTGMTALQINRQMVEAIKAKRVIGVTGFVNGHWAEKDPANLATLKLWQDAGIPTANHSWSHPNLNALDVEAYKQEIVRNEPLLQSLNPQGGWRWFRYPFLAEGDDPTKRAMIRTFLAARGYRIAGVSMDFSDWKFNTAYVRCWDEKNQASLKRMEDMYLEAARENVLHSRELARAIYGREIPLVQLMHVGALSARMMPRLIDLYRSMGAQFVSLSEAQDDPAYAEDNDPRLPARSQFLDARPRQFGTAGDPPKDLGPELDRMCR